MSDEIATDQEPMASQKTVRDPTKSMFQQYGTIIKCEVNTIDVAMWDNEVKCCVVNKSEDILEVGKFFGTVMNKTQVQSLIAVLQSYEVWMR